MSNNIYPIELHGYDNAQVMTIDDIPNYDIEDYDLFN